MVLTSSAADRDSGQAPMAILDRTAHGVPVRERIARLSCATKRYLTNWPHRRWRYKVRSIASAIAVVSSPPPKNSSMLVAAAAGSFRISEYQTNNVLTFA
jgi:hypothetical protein